MDQPSSMPSMVQQKHTNWQQDRWLWIWGITLFLPLPVVFYFGNYAFKHPYLDLADVYEIVFWGQLCVLFLLGTISVVLSRLRLRIKMLLIPLTFVMQFVASYVGMLFEAVPFLG